MSALNVFFENTRVGRLKQSVDLTYSFQYSKEWLNFERKFPLSLVMPLQEAPFGNRITLSFFENLLPEGDVLDSVGRTHQLESPYDFLKEHGEDCAGAVIVTAQKESPYKPSHSSQKIKIDMGKVYKAIENHHSVAHVIAELDPGYLSLAGAQDKFPAIFEGGQFFLPTHGAPTTHIVKAPIHRKGIKESVFNEYYCMQLASLCGFKIPFNQIIQEGPYSLFVIDRYDRNTQKKGAVLRVHQQDFCQAQGFTSAMKYESKGGPSIKDNFNLVVTHVNIKDRLHSAYAYLDWICFNLLIGNNDSHSKNISFLLNENKIELAPFYDLISTAIYSSLKKSFSFKIGDRDNYSQIGKKQFYILDKDLGLKAGTMQERMREVFHKVRNNKNTLALDLSKKYPTVKIINRISDMIDDRAQSFVRQGLDLID